MTSEAGAYASSLRFAETSKAFPQRGPLTAQEAAYLQDKLANDSQKFIYSSLTSIADAIRSLEGDFSTWPIVKFYYSAFYSVRALLALNGLCIFHVNKKPFSISCAAGAVPKQPPGAVRGSSHKFVFALYGEHFPSSPLLSQTIDGLPPFEWLMKQREDANYAITRFVEPDDNPLFRFVKIDKVRKLSLAYLKDDIFAFDPDHAIFAFPIYILNHVKRLGVRGNTCVTGIDEDRNFERLFLDRNGPLQPLLDLKRQIIIV